MCLFFIVNKKKNITCSSSSLQIQNPGNVVFVFVYFAICMSTISHRECKVNNMRRMQKLVISILRHRSLFKVSLDSELHIKIHKYTNINTNTQMQKLFRSISRHRSSPKGQTKILTKLLKVKQCSFALFNIVLNNSRPRLFPKSLFFPKSKKKRNL